MVGDPKRLSDLGKIEADVRIRCRQCRFEEDWSVEELTRHLLAIGGSTVWSEITRHLRCRRIGCGSPRLRAIPVPYARRQANVERRIGKMDELLVGTAVAILEATVARSPGRVVATIELRLALLVLHRYVRDPAPIRILWERASNSGRTTDEGLSEPLGMIRNRLEQRGWIAPRVLTEPTKTWPWSSPAPPGWLANSDQAER